LTPSLSRIDAASDLMHDAYRYVMASMGSRGLAVTAILLLVATAACGGPSPSPAPTDLASPSANPVASPVPSASPSAAASPGRSIASSGAVALLAADGSIAIVGADGRSAELTGATDGLFGFPTWSPDGSHIAAVRSDGTQTSVVVFDATAVGTAPAEPTVVFEKPNASPFYLYWTPDGDKVTFLATEADVLSLRLAPADGSAPIDGSGAGSVVKSGNPFYYDWLAGDRLFAHIGSGANAYLGEIELAGGAAGPALETPGDFRSGVVSPDHESIAFVRGAIGGPGEVVVSRRDGSNEHVMSAFGQTAVVFDPGGTGVASIGPSEPGDLPGFPLGPVRLMDAASGDIRTLVDGAVVSFWWSPDGKTIAALRVQPAVGSATPSASPGTEPDTEVRLVFVDVASGRTLSQPVVRPGQRFVSAFLAYFDQYALSHRVWAPDSSSILLPEVGLDGVTRVSVRFPDGSDPVLLDGEIGFWSP
jgi:WD40 repeat protein